MSNVVGIGKVVDFELGDRLYPFDFTSANLELTDVMLSDTGLFSDWVEKTLRESDCRYGIGGYNEHRTIYSRSVHFDNLKEPRRLHLGTDIWAPEGTSVYSFSDAVVHSFNFNDSFGDYGATIILEHSLEGGNLYVLYGHLSLSSILGLEEGLSVTRGVRFAEFGKREENGHWPPHLHFQVIKDMRGLKGDYPGVCQYSMRDQYLANSPNPDFILSNTFKTTSF
ncbi:peptidoglycan DD-metalloendopeptidase family protein [Pedobacter sp. JCM 36344]|uniref:peptidoglycan DD-metalloendopeptidase family protein n=1 Tax=Pedobacter sp. JCM 36344 TaxID=3374280 RepID=UPI00397A991B